MSRIDYLFKKYHISENIDMPDKLSARNKEWVKLAKKYPDKLGKFKKEAPNWKVLQKGPGHFRVTYEKWIFLFDDDLDKITHAAQGDFSKTKRFRNKGGVVSTADGDVLSPVHVSTIEELLGVHDKNTPEEETKAEIKATPPPAPTPSVEPVVTQIDDIDDIEDDEVDVGPELKKSGMEYLKKIPENPRGSQYQKLLARVLKHMRAKLAGSVKSSMFLAGDPGSGKTTLVENLAKVTGLPLVKIEAPHIVEEHIVSLPYVVMDSKGNVRHEATDAEMDIKFAESALVSDMKREMKRKISTSELERKIKRNAELRDLFNKRRNSIISLREGRGGKGAKYNLILFLDEFYRTGSKNIQNMLREILNGRIGNDTIPGGTYVIYASNLGGEEEGIDEIPENHEFQQIQYNTPSKDDWLNYMRSKYYEDVLEAKNRHEDRPIIPDNIWKDIHSYIENNNLTSSDEIRRAITTKFSDHASSMLAYLDGYDSSEMKDQIANVVSDVKKATRPSIHPIVWEKFTEALTEDDMGHVDDVADVRLSPRRLEDIMMYISANIPPENREDAALLINFVKTNLRNYLEQTQSDITDKILDMVLDIIKESSGLNLNKNEEIQPHEWMKEIRHQVKTKIKLGDVRKNVVTISGRPGMAKTTLINDLGTELGMNVINVSASNLTRDDVIGIPIADDKTGMVTFQKPPLYDTIMKKYEEGKKVATSTGPYKHILFIDETNRAEKEVFNAIRRLMLDKRFNSDYALPSDVMIMGAVNPRDKGTTDFTSHFRDVLDVVNGEPSFQKTAEWAPAQPAAREVENFLGFNLVKQYMAMLNEILTSLSIGKVRPEGPDGQKLTLDQYPFYLKLIPGNDDEIVYISPRRITDISFTAASGVLTELEDLNFQKDGRREDEEIDEYVNVVKEEFINSLNAAFTNILLVNELDDRLTGQILERMASLIDANDATLRKGFESAESTAIKLSEMVRRNDGDISKITAILTKIKSFLSSLKDRIAFSDDFILVVNAIKESEASLIPTVDKLISGGNVLDETLVDLSQTSDFKNKWDAWFADGFRKFVEELHLIGQKITPDELKELDEDELMIEEMERWLSVIDRRLAGEFGSST